NLAPSLGELLESQTGVAKRSFGPGSARPTIRGFDGDRVLILNDGMPAGGLGSQSGDHGEPVDATTLERVEIIKGPATLLYGSNAVGGVVNAVSRHHEMHRHRHEGHRGRLLTSVGSNNNLAGAGGAFEYGLGDWMLWGSGGGQRTGDYSAADQEIANAGARMGNVAVGAGRFGKRWFATAGYSYREGRYGIPFAGLLHGEHHHDEEEPAAGDPPRFLVRPWLTFPPAERQIADDHAADDWEVDVDWNYHQVRLTGGWQNMPGPFSDLDLVATYTHWKHRELEVWPTGREDVGTQFDNKQWTVRGELSQASRGGWNGTVGFQTGWRDYAAWGEEALSPPVDQFTGAVFAVEEWRSERWRTQFGARVEHARYTPADAGQFVLYGRHLSPTRLRSHQAQPVRSPEPERSFTGISVAGGVRYTLDEQNAVVVNLSSSYRPPALEELYNYGPHVGNLAFEIGNSTLARERSNGVEFSYRHSGVRLRGEMNLFAYRIDDFVYLAPTGQEREHLLEYEYLQKDSRFLGGEINLAVALYGPLWLTVGGDMVDAELRPSGTPLPRISPARARIALDFRQGNLSVSPELVTTRHQRQIFPTETPTSGYGLVNLKVSYVLPGNHVLHHWSAQVSNVGDRLYRNHVSLIKDLAPEMGRSVRFSYVLEFY
ncbi:MAG TPA: TonB-dependent receptor, partial [Acidobacteriota bacterium]|nr:TonB-dependent receptor [Acidobacteriota bacterium]